MTAVDSQFIRGLFDGEVSAAEIDGGADPASLFDEERQGQSRWAPSRRLEFAAGRQCAHRAFQALGVTAVPVIANADRSPRWPQGVCGSITHSGPFAAAVVARTAIYRSVGIDCESRDGLGTHLWDMVLVSTEREWLMRQPEEHRAGWALFLFSAKEAFYKCQYPVTRRFLDFPQVTIATQTWSSPGSSSLPLRARSEDVELTGNGGWRGDQVVTAFGWRESA